MTLTEDALTQDAPTRVVQSRRYGQWLSGAIVVAVVVAIVASIASNESIRWSIIGEFLFYPTIFTGLWTTIWLTIVSMVIGVVGGILIAVMRMSHNVVLYAVSGAYIWLFRGTPLLVQILLWYNLALFFPVLGFGPLSVDTNTLITPAVAALFALALNEAAYMAEIVRGGILAVHSGQREAGAALGMPNGLVMFRIVLPQAMKVVIPPTGNELITLLKMTSLVAVIGAGDLLTNAQSIGTRDFTPMEMLLVASVWYLLLTTIATYGQYLLEQRLLRSSRTQPRRSFLRQLLRNLTPDRVRA
jgi:polar amino acid transport system permease protein